MRTHHREILIYYNPESSNDRKTIAYAQSITPHVRTYSFDKAPSTGTSWQQILKALNLRPKDLLDRSHPYYQNHIRGRDFDDEGWLNVIKHNPYLIKAPIAIKGNKAVLCTNASDIFKLLQDEHTTIA